jgi:hypothetical protein
MQKANFKGCPTSLTLRELQIKTTMRYHLISILMLKIENNSKLPNTREIAGP